MAVTSLLIMGIINVSVLFKKVALSMLSCVLMQVSHSRVMLKKVINVRKLNLAILVKPRGFYYQIDKLFLPSVTCYSCT